MTAAATGELEEHRRALVGLGYRMLGSLADAEDVAQEALLRLHRQERSPDDPRAWLVRVSTRLAIDRLREAKARREAHVGTWLPDLLVTTADAAEDVARTESVSIALLVVLESLSPAERAAFVLHDVFGYGYGELAKILERSEAAARQLVSRARRRLEERHARFEPDAERRAQVAEAFSLAAAEGEMQPLVAVLTEDVVLNADSNGKRPAPRQPLHGPEKVAKFLLGVQAKGGRYAEYAFVVINGTPGAVVYLDGEADSIYALDVADGRVAAIHALRDPDRVREALERGGVPLSP